MARGHPAGERPVSPIGPRLQVLSLNLHPTPLPVCHAVLFPAAHGPRACSVPLPCAGRRPCARVWKRATGTLQKELSFSSRGTLGQPVPSLPPPSLLPPLLPPFSRGLAAGAQAWWELQGKDLWALSLWVAATAASALPASRPGTTCRSHLTTVHLICCSPLPAGRVGGGGEAPPAGLGRPKGLPRGVRG